MKNQNTKTVNHENNNINTQTGSAHQLSDNAFYLIALATLLKKMVPPDTLHDLLLPGKFVGFNGELSD